jgi:asparagine synthase (glutamine-hydrolysing)
MCGIAGIYPDGRRSPEQVLQAVDAMCARMATRGPDAHGLLSVGDGAPVLGHRRLSIIDLDPRSNQPLSSTDGRHVIVFNGEIYNYHELRRRLVDAGHVFQTSGDTEVLLALYRRHGRAMFGELRGMFAFAIWDAAERTLLLARDAYGIKPLYHAESAGGFAFASQAKALVSSGLVRADVSPAGLAGFYLWGSVPEPWSIYSDIQALPAGHYLEVRDGQVGRPRSWYDIRDHWRRPALRCPPRELEARVQSAVADSVRAHRVADVPVSVFLSGGIDSGSITGILASQGAAPLGITLGFAEFEGQRQDEVPSARAIAAHYDVAHHVRRVARSEFDADLPRILDAMDQPSIDGINTWFASKAAAERGYKVVLSGVGGDELLCGYASFERIPLAARLGRDLLSLPGARRTLGQLGAFAAARSRQPKLGGLGSHLGSLEGVYQLHRGLFMPDELPLVMDGGLAREGLQALGDFQASGAGQARDARSAVGLLESTLYLKNQLLRDSDWASMAHSIELRTPLCDTRLLEALGPFIPGFGRGQGKRMLARSPERPLDAAIIERRKTGFGLPMAAWMPGVVSASAPRGGGGAARSGEPWARRWARLVAARWVS